MSTIKLFALLESLHPLSEDFKSALSERIVPLSFPKGHQLLEVPKIASHAYFLNEGFAMSYSFSTAGKITESFWKPGQIIVAFESFFGQKPSLEVIELMKPSELLSISYEVVEQLLTRFPEALGLYRAMMHWHYTHIRRRLRNMKVSDHADQYNKLLKTFPDLELTVSQRSIATYLGIAPQSLARIKRKIE